MALFVPPFKASDFPTWTEYYWHYQYRLAEEYLLPCLEHWELWEPGVRVLDVGSGDGGASCALALAGGQVTGIELDPRRVELARKQAEARSIRITFAAADITDPATLAAFRGPYDIVLFRDVLEHIPDRAAALEQVAQRMSKSGGLVVIFPPYWSPYGGHQQLLHPPPRLGVRWAKLPYAHWLPERMLRALSRGADGAEDPSWEELATIRKARLTLGGLARDAAVEGFYLGPVRSYLSRPSFRLRYGLPVVGAGALGYLPFLRETLVTGVYALLRQRM